MSTVLIVLTNDYEVFGDGTGDIKQDLIEPTDRMMEIANRYSVPITLMVEMCEYTSFAKEKEGARGLFGAIKDQLIGSVKNNHDLQLHIHPQWINSNYDPLENKWHVDLDRWRTSSLTYEKACGLLKSYKKELEDLVRAFRPDYECFAFRAGAWSMQPEKDILRALRDTGFKIDTTVLPNCYYNSELTSYDFRGVPKKPYWFVEDDFRTESTAGILELPIYTRRYSLADKTYYKLIRSEGGHSLTQQNKQKFFDKGLLNKFLPCYVHFDFCGLDDNKMIDMVEDAKRNFDQYDQIPVIAIGHSKSFHNDRNLESFFKKALDRGYQFTVFKEIVDKLVKHD